MANDSDWFPSREPEQLVVVENIKDKIPNYKSPLEMEDADVTEVLTLCAAFIEAVTKNEQLQATAETMTAWKHLIKNGTPKGSPAPAPPVFLPVAMPAGTTLGVVDQLRDWRNRWVEAKGYTEAIGEDLMIVKVSGTSISPDALQAQMKLAPIGGYTTQFAFSLQGMKAMDVEWRFAGTENWALAKTFTASPGTHTVVPATPNQPVTVEYRGRLVDKNVQVGQWSPVYTIIAAP